ncbi:MAG: stalk domain-containing protein [Caldisericia bacterium]
MKRWKGGKRDWRSWVLGSTLAALFLVQLLVLPGAVQAATTSVWVERTPAGNGDKKWLACASDTTGQRLLAGDNGGRLWISADAGESWAEAGTAAGGMGRYWQACASDADGSTLIAAVYGGRLYRSTNSGTSWSAVGSGVPTTSQNWKAVASDMDGSTLVAAVYSGRLWLSANGGSSWSEPRPAGNVDQTWQAVACDANGLGIMALVRNGRAYASSDAGATWSEVRPAGDANRWWKACAMSADSSTLMAAAYPGRLYHSIDAGTTWTELRPAGDVDRDWQAVAVDADGSHLTAVVDGGGVWTSSDGGISWNEIRPSGVLGARWQCCASSADGSRLMAGADTGRLYTGLATWSLSYACAAGGVIAGITPQTVNHGASGTSVTAVPQIGYHFVSWSDASTVNPRTDMNVTADITVTATFAVDMFAITVSAGANGGIDPSGSVSVDYGNTQSFTIAPSTGYHIQDTLVDSSSVGAVSSYTFTNVTASHTITASFSIDTYTLTYAAGANGTIAGVSPQTVDEGASGTSVTASPDAGYHFVKWSDDSTANPRTDTKAMANVNVTATFTISTYTIVASASPNGSILPSGDVTVNHGASQFFTITPGTGYHVGDVLVDDVSVGAITSYTFTDVTEGHTITATFAVNTFAITVIPASHGTVTPGTGLLAYHAVQAYVFKPDAGYMIDSLIVDGVVVNEATNRLGYTVTLTSIEGPHTIVATFTSIPDLTAPAITLPQFGTLTGVTGWAGGAVQMFTVRISPFPLSLTLEDNSGSAKWTIKGNGCVVVDLVGSGVIRYLVPLLESRNDVEITASDAAGNSASQKLVIYLDSMNPVLTLDPALPVSVSKAQMTIKGSVVDAGSGLKHFTINGSEVIPYLDGSFGEKLILAKGANAIVIEAEDKVGHTASVTYTVNYSVAAPSLPFFKTVTLTIGKATMDVNGLPVALDVAPVIRENRTLVPLRALMEELGGYIAWNATTRQVTVKSRGVTMVLTIGKNTATVNGKSILIDAANSKVVLVILGSRTFLPLRFIAEQLGLDIAWYAPTRTVSITWEP